MHKWNRLLRRNKLPKVINDIKDEPENPDNESYSEDLSPDAEIVTENKEYEIVEIEIRPAKIICPDCGGITLEGLEFCDKCGGEI
ncbi:MAG: hypothetical protein GX379_08485 [Clostridiales bacterium]|jgi:hypothetical protein|nr:hypothetical protein [Clostridiales bacterium]